MTDVTDSTVTEKQTQANKTDTVKKIKKVRKNNKNRRHKKTQPKSVGPGLSLSRAEGQGLHITLAPGIDRSQPLSNLLNEGLFINVLDFSDHPAFGHNVNLHLSGSDAFTIRRTEAVTRPVTREISHFVTYIDSRVPKDDLYAEFKELTELYDVLTDAIRQADLEIKKYRNMGAGYRNNKAYPEYLCAEEARAEIIHQRDRIASAIRQLEVENDKELVAHGGSYKQKWLGRFYDQARALLDEATFQQLNTATDQSFEKKKED